MAVLPSAFPVGRFSAAEGQLHVRVRIDPAGNDELAGGVDRLVHLHLEVRADDGHALVFDQNIALVIVNRSHDAAILD